MSGWASAWRQGGEQSRTVDRDTLAASCHPASLISFLRFLRRDRLCRMVSGRFFTGVTRSERGAETTTPQQLKPGIARVTNPDEYVQRRRRDGALLSTWHSHFRTKILICALDGELSGRDGWRRW